MAKRHRIEHPLEAGRKGWRPNEYSRLIGGCSRQTVYNLIKRGLLDTEKVCGMRLITTTPDELYRRTREQGDDL
jgi:hypothetical protein